MCRRSQSAYVSMSLFDQCYQLKVDLSQRPDRWLEFWENEIDRLKQVPKKVKVKKTLSVKRLNYHSTLEYQSIEGYDLSIQVLSSSFIKKQQPTIIIFPDYVEKISISKTLIESGFTIGVLKLRGHEKPPIAIRQDGELLEKESYGYFAEISTTRIIII